MCLNPQKAKNPKYKPTKKNNFNPPKLIDKREEYVEIECGTCSECRVKKSLQWKIRLQIERQVSPMRYITLTFSSESLQQLAEYSGTENYAAIATAAVRLFTERWRQRYGKTIRHFLVTELGQNNTERLHLHGFSMEDVPVKQIEDVWQYGHVDDGGEAGEGAIGYIIKYISKTDPKHKAFVPKVYASKGIGITGREQVYKVTSTDERTGIERIELKTRINGREINAPSYLRKGVLSDEERMTAWTNSVDINEKVYKGRTYKLDDPEQKAEYEKLLSVAWETDKYLGIPATRTERKIAKMTTKAAKNLEMSKKVPTFAEQTN